MKQAVTRIKCDKCGAYEETVPAKGGMAAEQYPKDWGVVDVRIKESLRGVFTSREVDMCPRCIGGIVDLIPVEK